MTKVFILLFLASSFCVFSQQDIQFSQYIFAPTYINAANVGAHKGVDASLFYKDQFRGLQSGPKVSAFHCGAPFRYHQMGGGIAVRKTIFGASALTTVHGLYSYKLNVFGGMLSFGLQLGLARYRINFSELIIKDQGDRIMAGKNNVTTPDIGAGLQLSSEQYYLGVSLNHINQGSLGLGDSERSSAELRRHLYIIGAWKQALNEYLDWKPSFLLKRVDNVPIQFDLTNIISYKDQFWLGASFRTNMEVAFQAGMNLKLVYNRIRPNLLIGYAYEYPFGDLQEIVKNTQEIFLVLRHKPRPNLSKLKKQKTIKSPVIF